MVSIQVAGFGGEIQLQDVVILMEVIFVAVFITQVVFAPPNENVFVTFQDGVVGYPVCKALFCLAPSATSLQTVSEAFAGKLQNTGDIAGFFNLIISSFDVFKGLMGLIIVLVSTVAIVSKVYEWYSYWGVFS